MTFTQDELLNKIVPFIQNIGIPVHFESLSDDTFLPGIQIRKGEIIVDRTKILYPGDLLHEAGHIACVYPHQRPLLSDNVEPADDFANKLEIGVIAWSYAALVAVGVPSNVVFHKNGYQGNSDSYSTIYKENDYPLGVPLLEWMRLTNSKRNTKEGDIVFPKMIKWLREEGNA